MYVCGCCMWEPRRVVVCVYGRSSVCARNACVCVCIYIHKHYCEHVCGVYMYVYCVCDGNMCIYMCMNERMCAFVYICACEWEYENKAIE